MSSILTQLLNLINSNATLQKKIISKQSLLGFVYVGCGDRKYAYAIIIIQEFH